MTQNNVKSSLRHLNLQNIRNIYYVIVALLLILLFTKMVYIRLRENDSFDSAVWSETSYLDESGDSDTDDRYYYEEEMIRGEISYTLLSEGFEYYCLYPGTYELVISAQTDYEGLCFILVDKWTNTILAEHDFVPGESEHVVHFTSDQIYQNLAVCSYIRTDLLSSITVQNSNSSYREILAIYGGTLSSEEYIYNDARWATFFLLILILALGAGAFLYVRVGEKTILILTAMSSIASIPFLIDYIPSSHDIHFHLARILSLGNAILDHQLPQRISSVSLLGGEIVPVMYPEVFLYFPGLMCASGASLLFCYLVLCVLITFLTAAIAYFSARQLCDNRAALLFAFIYLFNPFRQNELFIRAAVGEALGLAFLPLIAVGMYLSLCREDRRDHKYGCIDLTIGYTGLISSHIIMSILAAYMCLLFVAFIFIVHPIRFLKRIRRLLPVVSAALVVIMANLWFIAPLLLFYGEDFLLSSSDSMRVQQSAPYLWQFFMGVTGFGSISDDVVVGMSLTTGCALLGGVLIFCAILFHDFRASLQAHSERRTSAELDCSEVEQLRCFFTREERQIGAVCIVLSGIFIYMSSAFFPWDWICERIPLIDATLGKIQYAWRMLAIVVLLLSAVLTITIKSLIRQNRTAATLVAGILMVVCVISGIQAETEFYTSVEQVTENNYDYFDYIYLDYVGSDVDNETIYGWILSGRGPQVPDDTGSFYTDDNFTVVSYRRNGADYTFSFLNESSGDITITVPVFWYGLHTAYLISNGSEIGLQTELQASANEHTQFTDIVIPGEIQEGTVVLQYGSPDLFRLSEIVSLIFVLIICLAGITSFIRNKKKIMASF